MKLYIMGKRFDDSIINFIINNYFCCFKVDGVEGFIKIIGFFVIVVVLL